jgi:hypothetical protein
MKRANQNHFSFKKHPKECLQRTMRRLKNHIIERNETRIKYFIAVGKAYVARKKLYSLEKIIVSI